MNNLEVIERNGILVVESREVAKMLEKEHKNLLRDIRKYEEILTSSNLSPTEFFIKSTYCDVKGEMREN